MKNPECLEWYNYAKMDLQAAVTLDEYTRPNPSEIICYHCQQFAEKTLKGFLIENNNPAPRTHDLSILCEMCIEIDERFKSFIDICKFLTLFGVIPRYPNELEISESDAKRALSYSQKIMCFFNNCGTEN